MLKKITFLAVILGLLAEPSFLRSSERRSSSSSNHESRKHYHEEVIFTYRGPKDLPKSQSLFLNFLVINLVGEANIKSIVKQVSEPNEKVKVKTKLNSSELVFAFIYSEDYLFSSFNQSVTGKLRVKEKSGEVHHLKFSKYDAKSGVTLYDPNHLEK